MLSKINCISSVIIVLFLTVSCPSLEAAKPEPPASTLSSCYILFDAGSSGTRLFIYEKEGANWRGHDGPKVTALADPIREIRGKNHTDIDAVSTEVVSTLDAIKQDGPLKKGKPEWTAFNWTSHCHVVSANVYATAGMRIAEQKNRTKSIELWHTLKQKLQAKVGESVTINTRTITGYEEGLYAWLAIRELKKNNHFGVVVMGGASSQVTFPCLTCNSDDDAVKLVRVNGSPLQTYSYSFLGLGLDEAPGALGVPDSCRYGAGTTHANWKKSDCADQIVISDLRGIRDPYNFNGSQQGIYRQLPVSRADVTEWYLTEKFNDISSNQIDACCVHKGPCKDKANACFQAVYIEKYLETLPISTMSEKVDVSWTLGAVICTADNCLPTTKKSMCAWLDKGCL